MHLIVSLYLWNSRSNARGKIKGHVRSKGPQRSKTVMMELLEGTKETSVSPTRGHLCYTKSRQNKIEIARSGTEKGFGETKLWAQLTGGSWSTWGFLIGLTRRESTTISSPRPLKQLGEISLLKRHEFTLPHTLTWHKFDLFIKSYQANS